MNVPFRRRHHDDEAAHDRARALVSTEFLEPLAEPDAAWLDGHLERCAECRAEREALVADRALLRSLRDRQPQPPRDLWARTSAALDAQSRPGRGRLANLGLALPAPGLRRAPLGALAGALVVLIVVATALVPRGAPFVPGETGGSSGVARISTGPNSTPLVPQADRVAWVQRASDGTYSLVFADVDHACPDADPGCAPLADGSPAPLSLAAPPQAVVLSPRNDQLAVVGSAEETAGSVVIVSVPTPRPAGSASPTVPAESAPSSPFPSGSAAPGSGHVIVTGVIVVGAASYSSDGEWFAFSARPRDGSRGPDLYAWHVGDELARRISDDGATFFAGWYGNRILASGIVAQDPVEQASPSPGAGTAEPSTTPEPAEASPAASGSAEASASPTATDPLDEAHPYSFLLEPVTGERVELSMSDVWLPTIDPTGRFITYWSGTVTPADATLQPPFAAGLVAAWRPATGRLVLDGWSAPLAPDAAASPAATGEAPTGTSPSVEPADGSPAASVEASPGAAASGEPASPDPAGSPAPIVGPQGTPIELAPGPLADFDAHFDPTGTRLAIWVTDSPDASAGRLWLLALDPVLGRPNPLVQPIAAPGVQALPGFSIQMGRLGWATPSGQDGKPSSVQVLAWKGDEFGQVQSVPGGNPQIVR